MQQQFLGASGGCGVMTLYIYIYIYNNFLLAFCRGSFIYYLLYILYLLFYYCIKI